MAARKRRPALEMQGVITERDRVWAAIRRLRTGWTIDDIARESGANRTTTNSYVLGWRRAGYINKTGTVPGGGRNPVSTFDLTKDAGVEAPRVDLYGRQRTQGQESENVWRAMRILGTFTLDELAATASTEAVPISGGIVRRMVFYCRAAGYVRTATPATSPGQRGGAGRKARYQFISARYTGPRPPIIRYQRQVIDGNTGTVLWESASSDEEAEA